MCLCSFTKVVPLKREEKKYVKVHRFLAMLPKFKYKKIKPHFLIDAEIIFHIFPSILTKRMLMGLKALTIGKVPFLFSFNGRRPTWLEDTEPRAKGKLLLQHSVSPP